MASHQTARRRCACALPDTRHDRVRICATQILGACIFTRRAVPCAAFFTTPLYLCVRKPNGWSPREPKNNSLLVSIRKNMAMMSITAAPKRKNVKSGGLARSIRRRPCVCHVRCALVGSVSALFGGLHSVHELHYVVRCCFAVRHTCPDD